MTKRSIGREAIDFLTGKNSLLDSSLSSFSVRRIEMEIEVEMLFEARRGAEYSSATLKFTNVVKLGLYWDSSYSFYNVEAVKLLTTGDGSFYLSIDPDQRTVRETETDQDFVCARQIELVTR